MIKPLLGSFDSVARRTRERSRFLPCLAAAFFGLLLSSGCLAFNALAQGTAVPERPTAPNMMQRRQNEREAPPSLIERARNAAQGIRDRAQMRGTSSDESRMGKMESRRARLSDAARERVRRLGEHMALRFEAAIDRLDRLASRVESRIEKFGDRATAADAATLLARAREKIADARRALADARAALATLPDSEAPRDAFAKVHNLFDSVKQRVKEAHAALVDAVVALKPAARGAATTTDAD